jgi:MtrB/PioB family decaheme-associated outer membrane protein
MNKRAIYITLMLSSGCLTAAMVQAQDQQDEGGDFSFSADSFSLAPAAAPPPVYDSYVEGGIGYHSESAYRGGRYTGLTGEGGLINGRFEYLKRGQWDGNDLSYIEASGRDLGLKSRQLQGAGGVQGKYKLFLDYSEIPYYDFRSLTPFLGVGSGSLTLPGNWQSNRRQDFNTATQGLPELTSSLRPVDMKTERTRYGGGVLWNIDRQWTARVGVEREKKEGLKPLGVAWGTSGQNAAAVVVPAPVDYRTDRVDAELGYQDRKMQFRLAYQFSRFDDGQTSLRVQNPFTYTGWLPASYPNGVAEVDLPPDNSAHMLSLSGGYNLSDTTRITANLGYSRYYQNDALLPYTANPLLVVPQGLPRQSADAQVSNVIANLELYGHPSAALDYKLRYHYTDRNNDTPQNLYLYVVGDAASQQTGTSATPTLRYNTASSFTEHLLGVDLGYRLWRETRLSLGYEYRNTDRAYSERSQNDQHTGRVGLRLRLAKGLTGSADYARTWRSGSSYDSSASLLDSYSQAYVASLQDAAFINHPELRLYNLADLVRDKASLRLTYAPMGALTLGGRLSYNQDHYNESSLGLTGVEGWSLSLDGSYRLSDALTLNAFYSYDDRTSRQAGWAFDGVNQLAESQDPTRRWWLDNDYGVHTVGAGLKWDIIPKLHLSANYVYATSRSGTHSSVGSSLDTGPFPDVTSRTHSLRSEIGYDLSNRTTLGLSYMYEHFRTSDWQSDGVVADTIGRVLSLPVTDPNYDDHVVLAWARIQF